MYAIGTNGISLPHWTSLSPAFCPLHGSMMAVCIYVVHFGGVNGGPLLRWCGSERLPSWPLIRTTKERMESLGYVHQAPLMFTLKVGIWVE